MFCRTDNGNDGRLGSLFHLIDRLGRTPSGEGHKAGCRRRKRTTARPARGVDWVTAEERGFNGARVFPLTLSLDGDWGLHVLVGSLVPPLQST